MKEVDYSWQRMDGSLIGAHGKAQKSIPGGRNIMWKSIKSKNMGIFAMQEEFFLGLSTRLDHYKMSLFRIFNASKRDLFSFWQAKGSLLWAGINAVRFREINWAVEYRMSWQKRDLMPRSQIDVNLVSRSKWFHSDLGSPVVVIGRWEGEVWGPFLLQPEPSEQRSFYSFYQMGVTVRLYLLSSLECQLQQH